MLVALILAAATGAAPAEWHQVVDGDVKVFTRPKEGCAEEVKGDMVMRVTAAEVRAVLLDDDYARRAPYMAEFREISHPTPTTWVHYTRLKLPIVDDRDYFIEITLESDLAPDGSGVYRSSWKPWGLDRPQRKGVVRMVHNEGYWLVKPTPDGQHAEVEYDLALDPGGLIPVWVADAGNKRILPDVMRGIEAEALRRRKPSK